MWCPKCSCGSEKTILKDRCAQCGFRPAGGMDFIDRNPLPSKPTRSIREMKKRINYISPTKDEKVSVSEDVAQVFADAKHNQ